MRIKLLILLLRLQRKLKGMKQLSQKGEYEYLYNNYPHLRDEL